MATAGSAPSEPPHLHRGASGQQDRQTDGIQAVLTLCTHSHTQHILICIHTRTHTLNTFSHTYTQTCSAPSHNHTHSHTVTHIQYARTLNTAFRRTLLTLSTLTSSRMHSTHSHTHITHFRTLTHVYPLCTRSTLTQWVSLPSMLSHTHSGSSPLQGL